VNTTERQVLNQGIGVYCTSEDN